MMGETLEIPHCCGDNAQDSICCFVLQLSAWIEIRKEV